MFTLFEFYQNYWRWRSIVMCVSLIGSSCIYMNHVLIFIVYTCYLVFSGCCVSMTFINTFGISIEKYRYHYLYILTRDSQWLLFSLPFLRLHFLHRLNYYQTQSYNAEIYYFNRPYITSNWPGKKIKKSFEKVKLCHELASISLLIFRFVFSYLCVTEGWRSLKLLQFSHS